MEEMTISMEEMIEERFAELASADGYETWWECESRWDEYSAQMIAEGLDEEAVEEFFSTMAYDM